MSTSLFSIVPITIIINGWFEKETWTYNKYCFCFSGLGGTICSPIYQVSLVHLIGKWAIY